MMEGEKEDAREYGLYIKSTALVLFRPNPFQPFVRKALLEYVSKDRFEWEDVFTQQRVRII